MAPAADYDEIADWYEQDFLARAAGAGGDPLGIDAALDTLLGHGRGACLEIGCGTGRTRRPRARAGLDALRRRHLRRDAALRTRPPAGRAG